VQQRHTAELYIFKEEKKQINHQENYEFHMNIKTSKNRIDYKQEHIPINYKEFWATLKV
jgi:hypothetical protein